MDREIEKFLPLPSPLNILVGYAADFDIGDIWHVAATETLRRRLGHAGEDYGFVRDYPVVGWTLPLNRPSAD